MNKGGLILSGAVSLLMAFSAGTKVALGETGWAWAFFGLMLVNVATFVANYLSFDERTDVELMEGRE